MTDQLSANDWLDQGLKTLARRGFTALKAEPLAKAMGVSRGSFYWHFADIGAYRAAILTHWREVAAEQVIAELETIPKGGDALALLLRRAFSARLALERAVRSWATADTTARAAVLEVERYETTLRAIVDMYKVAPIADAARLHIEAHAALDHLLDAKRAQCHHMTQLIRLAGSDE